MFETAETDPLAATAGGASAAALAQALAASVPIASAPAGANVAP